MLLALCALIARWKDLLLILPKHRRVEVEGVVLIEEAEPFVKTLTVWNAQGAGFSQTPLANGCRPIARLLQNLRNRDVIGLKGDSPAAARVVTDTGVSRMHPGHQAASRRSTDRAARVRLGETDSFRRHAIDVRSREFSLTVAAQIAITKVVGEDEDDVRPFDGLRWANGGAGKG